MPSQADVLQSQTTLHDIERWETWKGKSRNQPGRSLTGGNSLADPSDCVTKPRNLRRRNKVRSQRQRWSQLLWLLLLRPGLCALLNCCCVVVWPRPGLGLSWG